MQSIMLILIYFVKVKIWGTVTLYRFYSGANNLNDPSIIYEVYLIYLLGNQMGGVTGFFCPWLKQNEYIPNKTAFYNTNIKKHDNLFMAIYYLYVPSYYWLK